MDAHDIANRLMRRDNYLIALVNKDYFDTTVPIPFIGNQQFWTRSIEWNIGLCLMDNHPWLVSVIMPAHC